MLSKVGDAPSKQTDSILHACRWILGVAFKPVTTCTLINIELSPCPSFIPGRNSECDVSLLK